MKIACLQENLNVVMPLLKGVAKHKSMPVLNHVLLATDSGRLKIVATNLGVAVVAYVGAKIEDEGQICLPADALTDWVKVAPLDRIDIQTDVEPVQGTRRTVDVASVTCGNMHTTFKGISAEEFPFVGDIKGNQYTVATTDLLSGLELVIKSVSRDMTRPAITCVRMQFSSKSIDLMGCDGSKLSKSSVEVDACVSGARVEALVPIDYAIVLIKALKVALKASYQFSDTAVITVNEQHIAVNTNRIMVIASLFEGKYPELEAQEPAQASGTVSRAHLQQALKFVGVFAREVANEVRFSLNGSLIASADAPEVGNATVEIVDGYSHSGANVLFTTDYKTFASAISKLPDMLEFEVTPKTIKMGDVVVGISDFVVI